MLNGTVLEVERILKTLRTVELIVLKLTFCIGDDLYSSTLVAVAELHGFHDTLCEPFHVSVLTDGVFVLLFTKTNYKTLEFSIKGLKRVEGDAPWTSDLQAELATKRPHNHAERVQAEMNAALEGLAATVEAERATRAAKTPSPAEMQRQISLSREIAYRGPQQ